MKATFRVNYDKFKVGEIVTIFTGHTYGIKSDDEEILGVECEAVTKDENGGYPFVVVPKHVLIFD
jgi:hypothetical protein